MDEQNKSSLIVARTLTLVARCASLRLHPLFCRNQQFATHRCFSILLDLERTIWEGPALSDGAHTIVFDFKFDGGGFGKGGTGVLSANSKKVDKKHMKHTTPIPRFDGAATPERAVSVSAAAGHSMS